MDERRIVLLGKQGAGKSASGNTLLGNKSFCSLPSTERVTQKCLEGISTVQKQKIKVIDTPGWCDASRSETIKQEIIKCIDMSYPGPHVFLLVLPIGRFTNEEINTTMDILMEFGDNVTKYMIVLFTRGDDLEDRSIQDYLNNIHPYLRSVVQLCGGRYHVFNNKEKSNNHQVSSLLRKINEMVERNEGKYYTTDMFERVKDQQWDDKSRQSQRETVRMKNENGGRRNRYDAEEHHQDREGMSWDRTKQKHVKQKTTEEQNRIKNSEHEPLNLDIDKDKSYTRAMCHSVKDQQLDNKRRQQQAENYERETRLQEEVKTLRKECVHLREKIKQLQDEINSIKNILEMNKDQVEITKNEKTQKMVKGRRAKSDIWRRVRNFFTSLKKY